MTNLATDPLTYPDTCEEECGTCYDGSRDPRYLEDEYYCDPCFLETGVRSFNFLRNVGRPHHFCEDVTMAKTLTVAGVSTFMSDAFAQMNLFVYGNSEVDGNSLTEGNSTVVGSSFVGGNLVVTPNQINVGGQTYVETRVDRLNRSDLVLACRNSQ